jgi:hypothetical protein
MFAGRPSGMRAGWWDATRPHTQPGYNLPVSAKELLGAGADDQVIKDTDVDEPKGLGLWEGREPDTGFAEG